MDFRRMLKVVAIQAENGKIDSRTLSSTLMATLSEPRNISIYGDLARKFSVKRISADLDRLYRMGFLKRSRVSRVVHAGKYATAVKGFMYQYRLSRQGSQYLEYIRKPREQKEAVTIDQLKREMIADYIHSVSPGPVADFVEVGLLKSLHKDRGRYNRFPSRRRLDMLDTLEICRVRLRRAQRDIQRLRNMLNPAPVMPEDWFTR